MGSNDAMNESIADLVLNLDFVHGCAFDKSETNFFCSRLTVDGCVNARLPRDKELILNVDKVLRHLNR
jgi:hypothetical protein